MPFAAFARAALEDATSETCGGTLMYLQWRGLPSANEAQAECARHLSSERLPAVSCRASSQSPLWGALATVIPRYRHCRMFTALPPHAAAQRSQTASVGSSAAFFQAWQTPCPFLHAQKRPGPHRASCSATCGWVPLLLRGSISTPPTMCTAFGPGGKSSTCIRPSTPASPTRRASLARLTIGPQPSRPSGQWIILMMWRKEGSLRERTSRQRALRRMRRLRPSFWAPLSTGPRVRRTRTTLQPADSLFAFTWIARGFLHCCSCPAVAIGKVPPDASCAVVVLAQCAPARRSSSQRGGGTKFSHTSSPARRTLGSPPRRRRRCGRRFSSCARMRSNDSAGKAEKRAVLTRMAAGVLCSTTRLRRATSNSGTEAVVGASRRGRRIEKVAGGRT